MSIPLENDHNVYILGAGFSRESGLPLINDFLLRTRDSHEWLVNQKRTREAEAVEKVLRFRLEAAAAAYWVDLDLENIEERSTAEAAPALADSLRSTGASASLTQAVQAAATSHLLADSGAWRRN